MAARTGAIRKDSGEYGFNSPENGSTHSLEIPSSFVSEEPNTSATGTIKPTIPDISQTGHGSTAAAQEPHRNEFVELTMSASGVDEDAVEVYLRRRSKSTTSNGSKTIRKWSQTWKTEGLQVPGGTLPRSFHRPFNLYLHHVNYARSESSLVNCNCPR